jgi:hypothetical protein
LTALCLTTLLAAALLPASPAAARMNDDDLYCYDVDTPHGPDVQCEPFGTLRAECKVFDPQNTTEMCRDVNSMFVSPRGFAAGDGAEPSASFVTPGRR